MKKLRVHFIGIGGVSMSALAFYLKKCGHFVQGSDLTKSELTKKLENYGIKVFYSHKKENIKNADLVVFNYAIKQDNEELIFARKNQIKVISRGELLGEIAKKYKNVISIAGSHGKTSTTKMIYNCLLLAGKKPTLHIGGITFGQDFGFVFGKNDFFVTEACEYHDCFLNLSSKVGVVLNIEPEHLDYFKNFDNEKTSYEKFLQFSEYKVAKFGCTSQKNACTFGESGDIIAKNIKENCGKFSFDCFVNEKFYAHIDLGVFGKHSVVNSLAVIGVCEHFGISKKYVKIALGQNIEIKRRFELIQKTPKLIVQDYAHHPTEIMETIETFSKLSKREILVVFQPHTYSRTKNLMQDFVKSFEKCQKVIIMKTYPAREKFDKAGSAFSLYKNIKSQGKSCKYFASIFKIKQEIMKKQNRKFDVLILGAGNIEKLAEILR